MVTLERAWTCLLKLFMFWYNFLLATLWVAVCPMRCNKQRQRLKANQDCQKRFWTNLSYFILSFIVKDSGLTCNTLFYLGKDSGPTYHTLFYLGPAFPQIWLECFVNESLQDLLSQFMPSLVLSEKESNEIHNHILISNNSKGCGSGF